MSHLQDASQMSVPVRTPAPSAPTAADEPVRLCETCQKAHYAALRDDDSPWIEWNDHMEFDSDGVTQIQKLPGDEWPELPRLFGSAQAGCAFCAVLREVMLSDKFNDAWEHFSEGNTANSDTQHFSLEFWYGPDSSEPFLSYSKFLGFLIVRVRFEEGSAVCLRFQVEAITKYKAVAEWLSLRPPAAHNYDDDEITSFLTRELQKGLGSPESGYENRKFVPERLIDVGVDSLRLVDRKDIIADQATRPQYCALSYCWGPSEDAVYQTKTTRNTLERYLESLDFDALSPVLRDAVITARSLSIPYLWVDALCILQDDISDWQMQCSQMNDIYGKACVTLIAASSRTCREGFLNPKRLELQIPYQSARRPDTIGYFTIYFTHAFNGNRYFLHRRLTEDLHIDLTLSQWARRGWTFQEDAMAGARIIYGNADVYFARDTEVVSRRGPAGFIEPKLATSLQSKDELHGAWENILLRYSNFTNASFTNPRDVLPALSGLARLFGDILQEKYVAGYWLDRLHLSLMWGYISNMARPSVNDITERQSGKAYLVPTWSCLTRGRINTIRSYVSSDDQSQITILDIHMELDGTDPYGAIRDASLTLEGLVLDLASLSWSESPNRLEASVGSHDARIWLTEGSLGSEQPGYSQLVIFHPPVEVSQDDSITLDPAWKRRKKAVLCYHDLELDFRARSGNHSLLGTPKEPFNHLISRATLLLLMGETEVCGLVLIPCNGVSERSFLRIGIFSSSSLGPKGFYRQPMISKPSCLKRLMRTETIKIF